STRSMRSSPIIPASLTTSSTATTTRPWPLEDWSPLADTRRSRRRFPTPSTCRRTSLPGWGCGRSRSTPTARRLTPARPTTRASAPPSGRGTVGAQPLHAPDYLVYAYLQTGQDQHARTVLEELTTMQRAEPESFVAAYAYAAIPARLALEQHHWGEAAALSPAS